MKQPCIFKNIKTQDIRQKNDQTSKALYSKNGG